MKSFTPAILRVLVYSALLFASHFLIPAVSATPAQHTFSIGETDFLLDGKRLQICCGELHFARIPRAYWRHRLQLCKAMGLNTVCAYLFWNFYEFEKG